MGLREELSFSPFVAERIKYYVYRLIDPRNGETFYIGKGKGNRVFAHVKGELGSEGDELSDKLSRIRKIKNDGFDVEHVIHRHGIETDDVAHEVEAALLDAYPGITNIAGGHGSVERGPRHAKQIIELYEEPEAIFEHKAILINVNQMASERANIYEAVRHAWKLDPKKARKSEIVLAVKQGIIIGVFVADEWLEATTKNFPNSSEDLPGRWGFAGRKAAPEVAARYLRHRLPDSMRKRGAANPIRYSFEN